MKEMNTKYESLEEFQARKEREYYERKKAEKIGQIHRELTDSEIRRKKRGNENE